MRSPRIHRRRLFFVRAVFELFTGVFLARARHRFAAYRFRCGNATGARKFGFPGDYAGFPFVDPFLSRSASVRPVSSLANLIHFELS
jgi:hypothetical protein